MKTVVILYDIDDWHQNKPFKKNAKYRPCYEFLYRLAKKQGIFLARAYIDWYKGNGLFEKAWTYDSKLKKWVKIVNLKADFCEDKAPTQKQLEKKKRRIQREVGMINHVDLAYDFNRKDITAKLFKKYLPSTHIIKSKQELKQKIHLIKTEKAVLKPVVGSGGEGITIQEKKELINNKKIKINKPHLLQEFIDTTGGIPGIVQGTHDLRIVSVNGKIIYSYIRIPKKGKLLCNIHQGGSMFNIKNSQIPESALKMFKDIDKKIKKYKPRIYTVDLFYGNNKPYLIEINTMPGILFNKKDRKTQIYFYNEIIKAFKQGIALKKNKKFKSIKTPQLSKT